MCHAGSAAANSHVPNASQHARLRQPQQPLFHQHLMHRTNHDHQHNHERGQQQQQQQYELTSENGLPALAAHRTLLAAGGAEQDQASASPFIEGFKQRLLAHVFLCLQEGRPCEVASSKRGFYQGFDTLTGLAIWKVGCFTYALLRSSTAQVLHVQLPQITSAANNLTSKCTNACPGPAAS